MISFIKIWYIIKSYQMISKIFCATKKQFNNLHVATINVRRQINNLISLYSGWIIIGYFYSKLIGILFIAFILKSLKVSKNGSNECNALSFKILKLCLKFWIFFLKCICCDHYLDQCFTCMKSYVESWHKCIESFMDGFFLVYFICFQSIGNNKHWSKLYIYKLRL